MTKKRENKMARPFVLVNVAMAADGKIAFATENFVPFSSRRDREHMMELRATADAIICGARTVEVTGTVLGNGGEKFRRLRRKNGLADHPVRVVVSGSGSISARAEIFRKHFSPVIVLTTGRASAGKLRRLRAVADEVKICGQHEINFAAALRWLRAKRGVRRLVCEGGGELNGALFQMGLVDELHLTICPKIFGGRHAPTVADGNGFSRLAEAARLQVKSAKRVGRELFLVATKAN